MPKYPRWIPPLKKEVRRMLDPRKHPFWEFSEGTLFLARRGSETVGRIVGIIDRPYNQFHGEKMGIRGFFEFSRQAWTRFSVPKPFTSK